MFCRGKSDYVFMSPSADAVFLLLYYFHKTAAKRCVSWRKGDEAIRVFAHCSGYAEQIQATNLSVFFHIQLCSEFIFLSVISV